MIAHPPFDFCLCKINVMGKKSLRCRPLGPPDEGLPPPFAPSPPPKKKKEIHLRYWLRIHKFK